MHCKFEMFFCSVWGANLPCVLEVARCEFTVNFRRQTMNNSQRCELCAASSIEAYEDKIHIPPTVNTHRTLFFLATHRCQPKPWNTMLFTWPANLCVSKRIKPAVNSHQCEPRLKTEAKRHLLCDIHFEIFFGAGLYFHCSILHLHNVLFNYFKICICQYFML